MRRLPLASLAVLGSPSILVDGEDIDAAPAAGPTCRVYEDAGAMARAPAVEPIVAALVRGATGSGKPSPRRGVRSALAIAPGVLLALLPKGLCPACWPAYTAVLSAVGLGFLMQDRYLLPLSLAFLVVAVVALAYGARRRRGYGPAIVGAAAGLGLVVSKFVLEVPAGAYVAVVALGGAALWNAWPRATSTSCGACAGPAVRSS